VSRLPDDIRRGLSARSGLGCTVGNRSFWQLMGVMASERNVSSARTAAPTPPLRRWPQPLYLLLFRLFLRLVLARMLPTISTYRFYPAWA